MTTPIRNARPRAVAVEPQPPPVDTPLPRAPTREPDVIDAPRLSVRAYLPRAQGEPNRRYRAELQRVRTPQEQREDRESRQEIRAQQQIDAMVRARTGGTQR